MYSITHSRIANTARLAIRGAARATAIAVALTFASGCSLLSDNLDRAAKGVGKVVVYYCENITVPEIREEVRAAVNKHSAPHTVAVTCADGGPTLESTAPAAPEATGTPTAWNLFDYLRLPIFWVERSPILDPAKV
ncbi:MAG: hypothetical protein AB7P97_20410 [Hyphomonadaceae bacterium]